MTQVRVHLLDHPSGNRDADVWVDAFRVTVHYTTTEGPEPADDDDDDDEEPEPEVDDDDDEEPPREESAAEVDEPTAPGSDEACGCGRTLDSGAASASLFLLLPIARRRR